MIRTGLHRCLPACAAFAVATTGAGGAARSAEPPDAQDTTRPCRPTISCTAELAAPGTLEVEAGAQATRAGDGVRSVTFPFLLKQTLTPWLQAQLGSNGSTNNLGVPKTHYLDNLFVGPKVHLHDQGEVWPAFAVTALLSLPTFESDGYARYADASFVGHASKDVGPVHIDANVGLQVFRLARPAAQGYGALAASLNLPAPFGVSLEGYAFSNAGDVVRRDAGIRGVLTLTPRSWWVFDLGADAGLFPTTRSYTMFFGMTIIPVVFWRVAAPKA